MSTSKWLAAPLVALLGLPTVTAPALHAQSDRRAVTVSPKRPDSPRRTPLVWTGAEKTVPAARVGYAPVNGVKLYYEVRGSGAPLILIHGGLGAANMFGEGMAALAEHRQVIAVELQAHGHTADIDRPLRYEAMADDIAALIRHLNLAKADVMGYSLGGGVALRTAIQHPGVVRRLVLVSTPYRQTGWYPEIVESMKTMSGKDAAAMRETPMYVGYAAVAPRRADFPMLIDKVGRLLGRPYDWSAAVAAIRIPTLLIYADADAVITAHAVSFFEHLGGGKKDAGWDGAGMSRSRLAILPGLTHYNVFLSPALPPVVSSFLDGR